MGNARDTKFLNGHCPPLPVPSFFLMGIAHVCPCPKIVPEDCAHYPSLGSFLFRDFFGQKYLTKANEMLPFIFSLEEYLVKNSKLSLNWQPKKYFFLEMSRNQEFFILPRSSKFGL